MKSATPMICDAVVECIADARCPTCNEVHDVAERIWRDCTGSRSAFTWGELPPHAPERLLAVRAAEIALNGLHP